MSEVIRQSRLGRSALISGVARGKTTRSRISALLAAALVDDDATSGEREHALAALVDGTDLRRLPEAAAYHRVVGAVYLALKRLPGADVDATGRLARAYQEGMAAQLRLIGLLREATAVLDSAELEWLAVKGPILSHFTYSSPGRRLYFDVDILVRKEAFRRAVEALESVGWTVLDRNWALIRRERAGQLKLGHRFRDSVDLHWHLLYAQDLRRVFRIPMDDLFDRGRTVEAAGLRLTTFDPADTLIHLAVHACHEGGDRLVWLKDIEQAVVNDTPNWDDVVRRSRDWRVNLLVGTMLRRSQAELGTPVPAQVIRDLVPSLPWRTTLALLDRAWPARRSTGRGTAARLAARSTRTTVGATLQTFATGVAEATHKKLTAGESSAPWSRRDRWRDDPNHSESLLHQTGSDADRAAFLNLIAEVKRPPISEEAEPI